MNLKAGTQKEVRGDLINFYVQLGYQEYIGKALNTSFEKWIN